MQVQYLNPVFFEDSDKLPELMNALSDAGLIINSDLNDLAFEAEKNETSLNMLSEIINDLPAYENRNSCCYAPASSENAVSFSLLLQYHSMHFQKTIELNEATGKYQTIA